MKLDSKNQNVIQKQNQVCEKVIQLILSLKVPAHTVLEAVNQYVDNQSSQTKRS